MKVVLGRQGSVTCVIEHDATEYKPLIVWGSYMYDPSNKYCEVNSGKHFRIFEKCREEAESLYASCREVWENGSTREVLTELKSSTPATPPSPAPQSQTSSALDILIAQAVASIAVDNVVKMSKDQIDDYISETYGNLPKRIEVKSPAGCKVIEGLVHEKFETVLKLVSADIPVFLTGPAGSGKNVICKQISEALNTEFYFSNAVTQEYKLTGFIDANGRYHETQFYKAFTSGGIFMLDEIDASTPEVLVILNAAIANRYFDFPTGRVNAHEDFRIVAAGNTYGTGADIEYTGRYQLDAASLDRFAIVEIDYSAAIEEAIANGNTELVQFIRSFRKAVQAAKIKFVVSYRSIDRLAKLSAVLEKTYAIQIGLTRSLAKDDLRTIYNSMNLSANEYTRALEEVIVA
jgi:MoxR-like ATPase